MKRQYVQVKPSREALNPDDIVSHISSLHKLADHNNRNSIKSRLNPLKDSSKRVPEFEFLVLSRGEDSPVEFFYGTEEKHINTLHNRLTTAYPTSFDVEITDIDILENIIPPERFAPDDFAKQIQNGDLLFDPNTGGTKEDLVGGRANTTDDEAKQASAMDEESGTTGDSALETDGGPGRTRGNTGNKQTQMSESRSEINTGAVDDDGLSLNVARESDTTTKRSDEDAVDNTGDSVSLTPEQADGFDMLEELDAGLLDLVELPEEIDAEYLKRDIDGPTWTENGEILARPTLEHGTPVAVRWDGAGERKKDWMTTMKMFSKVSQSEDNEVQGSPFAPLIQQLSRCDPPIAFQVVFKRVEDWSRQAQKRKDNLHLNRDTFGQKVMYELGEVVHGSSRERRRERMRDPMEDIGESSDSNTESPIAGDIGKRRKLIDNKIPKRTFRANIRAVSVANNEVDVAKVERTMNDLASVLDHLDGYFYQLDPVILRDEEGYRTKKAGTEEFHRLINRDIVTGSGKKRPDIVANADELANFMSVPSSSNLTIEGGRGTRAEAESRDPLAKPDPEIMREFHKPAMRVGYALDKEAEVEPVPTQVPPEMLTKHYGRFATTGAGKSKALINDMLSLYENTNGPTIFIDPKGDGMPENYMKSHYERFGEEDFKDSLVHFSVPDILPGFSFFNIESEIEERYDENSPRSRKDVRVDVIQGKADHYQQLLKLVMGAESYGESKVAPILISSFIKILYDEEYVADKNRGEDAEGDYSVLDDRPSKNKFTHRQLEKLARQVKDGKTPRPVTPENEPIQNTIQEQIEGDEHTFAVIMNSVFNRLNYIREDQHLRRIFNNTESKFNFQDHLYDDKVIIFDLGDLRDDATMVMTGVIMTELWDTVQSAEQTVCTQNHDSIEHCRQRARRNGLGTGNLACREPWPDDHLINLIVDEAASVTVSSIMTKILERGRSFNLSVGLSMQFPGQMKDASDRVYKNVLNNVATKLIGRISLDDEISETMAHEGMDVEEFSNRISSLPRGEWIAQLPSPNFMETGPEPFSLQPLPIPSGHPESEHVLTDETQQRFEHFLNNSVQERTQQKYAVNRDSSSDESDVVVDQSNLRGGTDTEETEQTEPLTTDTQAQANGGQESPSNSSDGEYSDTQMSDVSVPDTVIGGETEGTAAETNTGTKAGANTSLDTSDAPATDTGAHIETGEVATEAGQAREATSVSNEPRDSTGAVSGASETTSGLSVGQTDNQPTQSVGQVSGGGLSALAGVEAQTEGLPNHVAWVPEDGVYRCGICSSEYYSGEQTEATECCQDAAHAIRADVGHPESLVSLSGSDGYTTSTETCYVLGEQQSMSATLPTGVVTPLSTDGVIQRDQPITRPAELLETVSTCNRDAIGAVASTLAAVTPPKYQRATEGLIEWFVGKLREKFDDTAVTKAIGTDGADVRGLIYDTPPAQIEIDVKAVLTWVVNTDSLPDAPFDRWAKNDCGLGFKQRYSGRVAVSDTRLVRPGAYGGTYNEVYGLGEAVSTTAHTVDAFQLPSENVETKTEGTDTGATTPVEKYTASGLTRGYLDKNGLTREEANFLAAVVKASNGELTGYSLLDSMSKEIKSLYDSSEIDEDKLIESGYLKKHSGDRGRIYYTVTSAGQEACQTTQAHGREVGDLGDDTPHRVGVELTKQYYQSLQHIQRVEHSVSEGDNEIDLRVYDDNGNLISVIEVEAGATGDGESESDWQGSHNYKAFRKDCSVLANTDGESVWVVRNHEVGANVLSALQAGDETDLGIPRDELKNIKNRATKIPDVNQYLQANNEQGVDKMLTYRQIRDSINE